MFDLLSIIISTLKGFVQRFTGIFSFIFDNYFPKYGDQSDEEIFFSL